MADTDTVARVQTLRTKIQEARDARTRAEAAREQAQAQLTATLTEAGCQTPDELYEKAQAAQAEAERLLSEAEAALA